jgi:gliding motility-associated-like protein
MNHTLSKLLVLPLLLGWALLYARLPSSKMPFSTCIKAEKTDTGFLCSDTSLRLQFQEDTLALSAGFISKTRDGNFLIPGYCYPDNGIFYNMPYLIKSSAEGNILWTKKYNNVGSFPSLWITAGRIQELANGDLLMTGQIGVPGTDDRRELAVWRLDKNGNLIWSNSYESELWTNPITGATQITGIQEDSSGNIFLCGDLKIFEASKFAFILKLDGGGNVLWDGNYSGGDAFACGLLLVQNKLLLIGGLDPILVGDTTDKNVLWCLEINPTSGQIANSIGWAADFGEQSTPNSFDYANSSVSLLDNGLISVQGTTYADFLGSFLLKSDTIYHSIIANFSPDFNFQAGILVGSKEPSNYYNTVTTQEPSGRISFTRFSGNNDSYHEDIVYGSILNNRITKERLYREQNRSSQYVSNFLFFPTDQDLLVQTYWNNEIGKGGLEILRLRDEDTATVCNGKDSSLSILQPYRMRQTLISFDSIRVNCFRQTYHNMVNAGPGNINRTSGCALAGVIVYGNPVIDLDKDSVLCQGTGRELSAGSGYSQYSWNNGNTGPSIMITDTGRYWVSVTSQNGCKGSDTTHIARMAADPAGFLPPDTTICDFSKLIIKPLHDYESYLWNDQSTGPAITISQPGLYVLEVTDSNQCSGTDSMEVAQKECLEGLYVPNAFTPNGDGRNDFFKPLVFGNVAHFRFAVYNRWGEKVFETFTLGQGWDGRFRGVPVPAGGLVWYCQYQVEGSAEKTRNGTVALIR